MEIYYRIKLKIWPVFLLLSRKFKFKIFQIFGSELTQY